MQPNQPYHVYVGFDAQELRTCNIAIASLHGNTERSQVHVDRISRLSLFKYYARPTSQMPTGQLYDDISDAPMSTDHAIARFFVPFLMNYRGWALFTDGDVLFRDDVRKLFAYADDRYAVQVVQHPPQMDEAVKKLGHVQSTYPRKNWSSVVLWNCGHPSNAALTVEVLNAWPGRDLHAFSWLSDDAIGALPSRWNYLVGVSDPDPDPAIVHYTLGTPDMPGHANDPYATEWFFQARHAGYRNLQQEVVVTKQEASV